jgi:hypothetical protein
MFMFNRFNSFFFLDGDHELFWGQCQAVVDLVLDIAVSREQCCRALLLAGFPGTGCNLGVTPMKQPVSDITKATPPFFPKGHKRSMLLLRL